MKKIAEITFVEDEDKEKALALRSIEIPKGAVCLICGEIVTLENLGMVIPRQDGYEFVCSEEKCMLLAKLKI